MATEDFDGLRLTTEGGIRYRHVSTTYEEDDEAARGTQVYVMRVTDIDEFLIESMPPPQMLVGIALFFPKRTMPGASYLVTKKIKVDALDQTKPINLFGGDPGALLLDPNPYGTLAKVTIDYETMNNDPNDFLAKSVQVGAEFLPIPAVNLEVSQHPEFADPLNAPGNPYDPNRDMTLVAHKIIPTAEWTYRWAFCVAPQWRKYFTKIGKVNAAANPAICENAEEETVLFSGMSGTETYRYYRNRLDGRAWSLDFKFSQRVIIEEEHTYGWNHVYVPNPENNRGEWRKLKRKNTGLNLYETTDMYSMFLATDE